MILSSLLFLIIPLIVLLLIGYLVFRAYSRNADALLDRLLKQTAHMTRVDLKNIHLTYHISNGPMMYPSINNSADIYLFDNFMILARRQNFILQIDFKPSVISKDPIEIQQFLDLIDIDKIEKVSEAIEKGEFKIHLTALHFNYYKTVVTLKGLTVEQLQQLSHINNWSN